MHCVSNDTKTAPSGSSLDLFPRRIPRRPFATDCPGPGLHRMSPQEAIKRRHLQVNPPSVRFWLLFDVDKPTGALAWDDAGLPEPAWTAQNPANGHAHSAWGIEAPVLLDKPDRQKPVRYLAAIESAYRSAMAADPAYGGLLTKNPLSPHWRTFWGQHGIYGLDDLAEYVDLDRHKPRRGIDPEQIGLGRNVALFDWLRLWAYRSWRRYKLIGATLPDFADACRRAARERNAEFKVPLHDPEVMAVAKSVSSWVWQKFSLSEFERIQRQRGQSSGAKRKSAAQKRRERLMPEILDMIGQGHSQQVIADTVGVSQKTISNWIKV